MTLTPTSFSGAYIVDPQVFTDNRGWFLESWNRETFATAGLDIDFVQDNHSKSCARALRGLHFQAPPHAQAKLVRCVRGSVWDVIVDIRRDSPTYRRWEGVTLTAESHRMVFVPIGFAHGFCVLSDGAEVQYKCSDFYAPDSARGIAWDDPGLAIDWPVADPVLSDQDRMHPPLTDDINPF